MFCINCGKTIIDGAAFCPHCGAPTSSTSTGSTTMPPPPPPPPRPGALPYVKTFLPEAILITLFCCIPFGIVAIVHASQVSGKLAAGDIQGAQLLADKARTWVMWGFITGLISCVCNVGLQLFLATLGAPLP